MSDAVRLRCRNEERRELVRKRKGLNGLDYVEVVGEDQKTLRAYFLGKAPEEIGKDSVRIEGGRRIVDIQVTDVQVHREEDPERDDFMEVTVDGAGDFSTYRLCLVEEGEDGRVAPRQDFDPRYACVDFSFKAGCPSDLDCKPERVCPPPARSEPEISYLAKDYASFRQLILDRLALVMPDWRERHVPDIGIALVEVLAYVGDYLSYYQDAVATEAYLDTARRRISVRRHARLVDYRMHEGCNARAWLWVWTASEEVLKVRARDLFFTTVDEAGPPAGQILTREDVGEAAAGHFEIFEPLIPCGEKEIALYQAHNTIHFYTWGDRECCLPKGATRVTLRDGWVMTDPHSGETAYCPPEPGKPPKRQRTLHLQEGDFLVLEEVNSSTTGLAADADPAHRQVVRLTHVSEGEDPLVPSPDEAARTRLPTPILEIEWHEEDRLPFALCLSSLGPAPDCAPIPCVSVAHGNVILVDHGRCVCESIEGEVPTEEPELCCEGEGLPSETAPEAGRFTPRLRRRPLTFAEPPPKTGPAAGLLDQDPHRALPGVRLTSTLSLPAIPWSPRGDLLESGPDDADFVVEIDDEGLANIRFGDGELGRRPDAAARFEACYRLGNGPSGNVGAETIRRVGIRRVWFYDNVLKDVSLRASNPLPARGGTAPEPLAEVKLLAPHAFRPRRQRAITADDYAYLAKREPRHLDRESPKVQSTVATLRWTGSWYQAQVAVDPLADTPRVGHFLAEIRRSLGRYRRMGHDLRVGKARYVPLLLELCVCVRPHYLRGHVEAALLDAFSNRAVPDGRLGFFHPDRLTFGEGVYLSPIVAAAQAVTGVESVTVMRLERQFEGPNDELLAGVLPLGPTEIARLDNDPNFPENGVLRLHMKGGR